MHITTCTTNNYNKCFFIAKLLSNCNYSDANTSVPAEIEMLVDDPKDYEELHEMALDQELCIHITEDMLTMSPDQTNGYSGTDQFLSVYFTFS